MFFSVVAEMAIGKEVQRGGYEVEEAVSPVRSRDTGV